MIKYKKYLLTSGFLLAAFTLITIVPFNPLIVTTQDVGAQTGYRIKENYSGFVVTQEITMKKDYLTGIGLFFTLDNKSRTSDYLVMVQNNKYQVIHRETLSSKNVKDYQFYPVNLKKSVYIGKGNTVFLSLYSDNGEEDNHLSIFRKPFSALGKLYASPVVGNDIPGAVMKKTKDYPGSFVLKTYESKVDTSRYIKLILYFLATGIAAGIFFSENVFRFFGRITLNPAKIFAVLSVIFGVFLIFLIPPFQVPDEQSHFNRAYQVSDFDFFQSRQTVPRSLVDLDSVFQPMKFNSDVKTSRREILAQAKIKLNPGITCAKGSVPYLIPYIPSAAGIFPGRVLNLPPLLLLYLGRLFNLMFSIIVIYHAIKIVPVHKWIFFLIALMPMALFMRCSLSYDVMKTSLSFLLLALLLRFAYDDKSSLTSRKIVLLITVITLLALSKVPYFIAGLVFLLIPVKKCGSMKKYWILFLSMLIVPGIAIKLFSFFAYRFGPQTAALSEQSYGMPSFMNPTNIDDQKNHILGNIPDFIVMMLKTIFVYRGDSYLTGFVGNLGWLDTPFPSFFIALFLVMLVLSATGDSSHGINPGWRWKIIPFLGFVMAVVIIETVYYINATPLKGIAVEGVQGRYFIPYAPLLFLLFYNSFISNKLNLAFSLRKDDLKKLKSKERSDLLIDIQQNEQIFSKTLHLLIVCFILFSLSFTVYILAHRYYYIGTSAESVEAQKEAEKTATLNYMKQQEDRKLANSCFTLAKNAFTAGKLDSTAFYLEKVLSLDEKNSEAANNLAFLYLQQNQKNKAILLVEKMKANGMKINKSLTELTK